MVKIVSVHARQVLDSRGNPTVEAELSTSRGHFSAIVPSGASTGAHEAMELRDGAKEYAGKGVLKAVENVNSIISPKVSGRDFFSLDELDSFLNSLDGTANKSALGANAILPVSMAFCRALASHESMRLFEYIGRVSGTKDFVLPVPFLNVLNGGKHAGRENDIQEHMLVPSGFASFSEALRAGTETYHVLKGILRKKYGGEAALLGDEGGFCPKSASLDDRLEMMGKAVSEAGYSGEVHIALDCASSEFFKDGNYNIDGKEYTPMELVDFYAALVERFGLVSIEDGFAEDDWSGWRLFNSRMGKKIEIVGDDLLVTSVSRMKAAIERKACNALLLKVNQIGTVTESVEAARLAFRSQWRVMVSHRSGESEDSFISDLVVGLAAGQSKFGAPARSERTAKYNQLLRIEEALAETGKAKFAGKGPSA
ncbi:MAG: phosphopyruvate hydratase [Candidatus Diapherotrites archaeon]|uniref:Enolase n=1 Tax=Candidatus Iainarchaeum sp. TaxID=3101447 RepID=A0A8T3YQZ5_9ARCH|nr:phosphopyruvate hydratase [Candidatus Diapherotrites archaeon]